MGQHKIVTEWEDTKSTAIDLQIGREAMIQVPRSRTRYEGAIAIAIICHNASQQTKHPSPDYFWQLIRVPLLHPGDGPLCRVGTLAMGGWDGIWWDVMWYDVMWYNELLPRTGVWKNRGTSATIQCMELQGVQLAQKGWDDIMSLTE